MSDFDAEAQAMASVNTSNKVLEDMFSAATGVLESYAMQRDRLKVSRLGVCIHFSPSTAVRLRAFVCCVLALTSRLFCVFKNASDLGKVGVIQIPVF